MNLFEAVSLSASTVTRRIEEMSDNLRSQLLSVKDKFECFSIALDESCDVSDTSQMLVFIRGIDKDFQITEELAALHSLKGTTTGLDVFERLQETLRSLNLDWNKLTSVTTDGAKSMVGRLTGLIGRINTQMEDIGVNFPIALHCIIHQQALRAKSLDLDCVMKTVFTTVNYIRAHALNHRQFRSFFKDVDVDYDHVIYHSEVRWLSRGKVLKRFFELRKETCYFMTTKGRPVAELSDGKWVWQLAFLADVTQHLNDLNLRLQGKAKLVNEMFYDVKSFDAKLSLFEKQLSTGNLAHFKLCQIVKNDDSVTIPFPESWAKTAIDHSRNNSKTIWRFLCLLKGYFNVCRSIYC